MTHEAPGDHRIVVTGIGLNTSLGFGAGKNWQRLLAGESAIRSHDPERFPPPVTLPTRLGAAMDREALAARIRETVPRTIWNTSAEVCHLWLLTALEALACAGLDPEAEPHPERVGIFVGNGGGAVHFIEQEYANIYTAEKAIRRDVSRMGVPKYTLPLVSHPSSELTDVTTWRNCSSTVRD